MEWAAHRFTAPSRSSASLWAPPALAIPPARACRILSSLAATPVSAFASPYQIALGYAYLGDHAAAIPWLNKSADAREGQILYLKYEPIFDGMRTMPAFLALEKRVGLLS